MSCSIDPFTFRDYVPFYELFYVYICGVLFVREYKNLTDRKKRRE